MNLHKSKAKWFMISILVVVADLLSKYLANTCLKFAAPVKITSFFNLTLLYNHGAAFSFLSNANTSWQMIMFSIISLIASIVIIVLILRLSETQKFEIFSLSLILGGALGNLYDRAFQGYVIDFLDFHIETYHWPAFNIADSAITIGVILYLINNLFFKKNNIN